jgi:hypothetical protein
VATNIYQAVQEKRVQSALGDEVSKMYQALPGGAAYAMLLQGYARVTSMDGLYAMGISSVLCYAICETAADGMLVQMSGGCPKRAMALQANGTVSHTSKFPS